MALLDLVYSANGDMEMVFSDHMVQPPSWLVFVVAICKGSLEFRISRT